MTRASQLNGDLPLYTAIVEFIGSENKDINNKLDDIRIETAKKNNSIDNLSNSINRFCDLADKHANKVFWLIAIFMGVVGGANILSIITQFAKWKQ